MDIFKFNPTTSPTKLERGEIVNGLTSKMWIERYRSAGEFTFHAHVSTRDKLPIGSLISHLNTTEVMIVEDHVINDDRGQPPQLIITGRGFETFFDHRIVGSNKAFPTSNGVNDYVLAADETWDQVVTLINQHILPVNLTDDDNEIPYVSVLSQASGAATVAERAIKRGGLYTRALEILEVDNLGIKVVRPGPWSPLGAASTNIAVVVHRGVDRTSEIIYSYDTGEIESADYLWSNRKLKNCAVVSGRWVEVLVDSADSGYNRRMMHVDASDIDETYSEAPTGTDLTNVQNAMHQRGVEALAAQKELSLTKAEVSQRSVKTGYRTDFDLGDLITVSGDYNATSTRRIEEYVEIEDKTGTRAYPTLTVDE